MDLRETMAPYYPELHDEKKIHRQISALVSKFEEWGIFRKVRIKMVVFIVWKEL